MNAKDFKATRRRKGYSQSELALELDVHVMTVSKWERRLVPIPRMAELSLLSLKPKAKKKGDK
jgi:DNA-binding transcriptional regulator YiaG